MLSCISDSGKGLLNDIALVDANRMCVSYIIASGLHRTCNSVQIKENLKKNTKLREDSKEKKERNKTGKNHKYTTSA